MTKPETLNQTTPTSPSAAAIADVVVQAHAQDPEDQGKENKDKARSNLPPQPSSGDEIQKKQQPKHDDTMTADGEGREGGDNDDQDRHIALCKANRHPWLEQLFLTVFFDNCSQHAGNKQERKYFCKKSSQSLCFYCLRNHEHGEEDIIQVAISENSSSRM